MDWTQIKYFTPDEFDSPDAPGSGQNVMNPSLIRMLDQMRGYFGRPLHINSGYRTPSHNAAVGGTSQSAHLTGDAADIRAVTGREKWQIVKYAMDRGVMRIGIGSSFVHLDVAVNLPSPSIWTY